MKTWWVKTWWVKTWWVKTWWVKTWLAAVTALAWLCSAPSVGAADFHAAPALKAPPIVTPTWSGLYLGLDAGVQATRTDLTTIEVASVGPFFAPFALAPGGAATLPYDGTGFRAAAFGGYNWQVSPRWVLGVEGDIGWADNKTTLGGVAVPAFLCCANSGLGSSVRTTWDASLRARIGYLVTPGFLTYLTGGVAWQHFEQNSSCGAPFCVAAPPPALTFEPFSFTHAFTKAGWTVGGGIEAMLWSNWLMRAAYRYAEFGTVTFSNTDVVTGGVAGGPTFITSTMDLKVRTHTASLGIAYKLGAGAQAEAAPIYKAPPPALTAWSGFHVGLDAGLRSTRTDVTTTSALVDGIPVDFTNFATTEPLNGRSFRFGLHAGYDWQVASQWVIGVEGDWGWGKRTATLPGFPFTPGFFTSGIATDALSVETTWDASARGRIGHLVTPTLLAYVTGGAAWLHYGTRSDCPGLCTLPITTLAPTVITSSITKTGWTIGGGFESSLGERWFARAEYRYADFGNASFVLTRNGPGPLVTSIVDNFDVGIRTHTVAIGMGYRLSE
jgi:outer membrane immunogenic protein